jgi:hypothetical protein
MFFSGVGTFGEGVFFLDVAGELEDLLLSREGDFSLDVSVELEDRIALGSGTSLMTSFITAGGNGKRPSNSRDCPAGN